MPHWLTWIWSSRPLFVLGTLTVLATGDERSRAAPDVRPVNRVEGSGFSKSFYGTHASVKLIVTVIRTDTALPFR